MNSSLLRPFELAYRGASRLRRSFFRRGLLKSKRLPRPVISIGNRSFGGSGKTPFAIALCRRLTEEGWRVVILSRGYGRRDENSIAIVNSEDAALFGDEPVLLRRHLPSVDIVVGADRFQAGMEYLAKNDCDLFVLDDGFQHLQLARDLDIVLEADERTFFREGASALEAAGFVVRRSESSQDLQVTVSALVCGAVRSDPSGMRDRRILVFSGLANNERFFETVRSGGAKVVSTVAFPDHHRYTSTDVDHLRQTAASAGAELLVTTEKDWVKLRESDICHVEIELAIRPDLLESIVERVRTIVGSGRS